MSISKTILASLLLLAGFLSLTRWQHLSEEHLLQTDAQGYYAYLPAIFIHQDLQFHFVEEVNSTYYTEDKRAAYVVETPNGNVNKYFAGTAVLQSPFFLLGMAGAAVSGYPVDGYSLPFQLSLALGAMVYLTLGLKMLASLLLGLRFRTLPTLLTVLTVLFGTNLLYYSIYEPGMSHVYSFFTVSGFLLAVHRWHRTDAPTALLGAGTFLGLTILIRPTNAMILLAAPVMTNGSFGLLRSVESIFTRQRTRKLLVAVAAGLAVVMLQPLIYRLQTGNWFVWSYQGEGFDLSSPALANVLFSFRKGLFVYCPLLILAVAGIFSGMGKKQAHFGWLLFALGAITWVISSWWMWYYGGSFGHRTFIEFYPLFGIGLAYVFQYGWGVLRPWIAVGMAAALTVVSLVQTYQYRTHILPFDNMDAEKYRSLFLRTGQDLAWYYGGYKGEFRYAGKDSLVIVHDMEQTKGWGNADQRTEQHAFSGKFAACMTEDHGYGPTLRIKASDVPANTNVVRVSAMVRTTSLWSDVSLVCSIEDTANAAYYWHKRPLRPQFSSTGEWTEVTALFKCGAARNASDSFILYPMRSDNSTLCFDDITVSFVHAE